MDLAVKQTQYLSLQDKQQVVNNTIVEFSRKVENGEYFQPKNFNAQYALQGALQKISNVKVKSNDVGEFSQALLDTLALGVYPQKDQVYFIDYDGKISAQLSYFGEIAIAERNGYELNTMIYHEGDILEVSETIDGMTISKNLAKLENRDNPIKYVLTKIVNTNNGEVVYDIMTAKEIEVATNQSKAYGDRHFSKKFPREAAKRTAIRHALKMIVKTKNNDFESENIELIRGENPGNFVEKEIKQAEVVENNNGFDLELLDEVELELEPAEIIEPVKATKATKATKVTKATKATKENKLELDI